MCIEIRYSRFYDNLTVKPQSSFSSWRNLITSSDHTLSNSATDVSVYRAAVIQCKLPMVIYQNQNMKNPIFTCFTVVIAWLQRTLDPDGHQVSEVPVTQGPDEGLSVLIVCNFSVVLCYFVLTVFFCSGWATSSS